MLPDIDFTTYKDKTQVKGFSFRNEDDTYYDFTGSSVVMDIYFAGASSNPITVTGTINTTNANVSFILAASLLEVTGNFEYIIIETNSDSEKIPLIKGNILVKEFVPFSASIEAYLGAELPVGFVLDENFVNQKTRYWRLFLQDAFDISTPNLFIDGAWPELTNALIAKIIAYEGLVTAIKGNLLSIFGGTTISTSSSSTNGDVKSIETGPSKVEFFPVGETLSEVIKNSSASTGILTVLAEDLCGLSSKLSVKIPMCKAGRLVKVFTFYKNPDLTRTIADELTGKTTSRG